MQWLPTFDQDGLRGSVLYHDGQFDDARLAIHLAMTAADHGAVVINYMSVEGLMKENEKVCGVIARDTILTTRMFRNKSQSSYQCNRNFFRQHC